MEDQLISYETGIVAKEKKFTQNPYLINNSYAPTYTDGSEIRLINSLYNPSSNLCTAPSQSIIQKWLRDEHNIHIHISRVYEWHTGTPIFEGYCLYIDFLFSEGYNEEKVYEINHKYLLNLFPNFEEALEKGLFEALTYLK